MDPPPFDAFLASIQMVGSTVRTLLLYLYSFQHTIADKLGFAHPTEPTELDEVADFAIPFIRYLRTLYDTVPRDTIPNLNTVPELLYILWPVIAAILITASLTLFGPNRFTLHTSTMYILFIAAIPIVCNFEVDESYHNVLGYQLLPSWALVARLLQGWNCATRYEDVAHLAVRFLLLAVGAQIGMVLHTITVWIYCTVRIAIAVVRSVFCLPFKVVPALRGAIKPHLREPECPSPVVLAEELAAPVEGLVAPVNRLIAPVDELATPAEDRTAPAEEPPASVNQLAVCPDELDCGEDERLPADQLSSASPDIAADSAEEKKPISVAMDANPSPPSPPLPPASDDSVSERSEHSSMTLNRPLTVSEDRPENAEALDSEPNKSEVSQPDADKAKPAQTFNVAYTAPSSVYAVPFIDYAACDPANSSEQVCLEDDHIVLSQNDQIDDEQKTADVPPSTSPLEASTPVASELGTDAPTTLTTPITTSHTSTSDADAAPPTSPWFEEDDEMPDLRCHPRHVPHSDPLFQADIDTLMDALDPSVSDDVREFLTRVSSDYLRFGFLAALMTRMDAHPQQIKTNFELLDDDGDSDDEDEPLASWQQGYHLGGHHASTFIFAQDERPRDPSPLEVEQTIRAFTHKIIWRIYMQSDIYTGWDDFEDPWGAHRYKGVEPWCMDVYDCRDFVLNGCDMGARDLKVLERAVLFSVLHHDVPFVRLPRSQGAPFVDPHVWEVVHMYVRLMADSEVYSRMLEKVVNFLNGVTRK